ncbi:MAG: helix-turn-helix domain-containing protein [Roseburia sp.]
MNKQTNCQIPYFAVTDPYDVVYRKNSASQLVLPHTHNALEIYFTLTDLPDVLLNDTVSSVSSGSLVIIPPYNVHQLYNQRQTVYERYIISINSEWLQYLFQSQPDVMRYAARTSQPFIVSLSSEEQVLLEDSLKQFLKADSSFDIKSYALFFSLFDTVDELITKNMQPLKTQLHISKSQHTVNEIIAYINAHLMEPLTLQMIADHFYMNKDYLGRLFKKHTHATIGHYIAMQKLSIAQLMLAEGQSVSTVQEHLGFTSYAYFFKFFKKMTGISPSYYRKTTMNKKN